MEKLWVIMVGGYPPGAHVEVHDVRFVVGAALEDCFDDIKRQWWGGAPERLHIDAWGALEWADGHGVTISDQPPTHDLRLWFANLGGYDPAVFNELHKNVFVVARDQGEAKKRALATVSGWASPHRDVLAEVEMTVDVAGALADGKYIHLDPDAAEIPFQFEARYLAKLTRAPL
ncbi:MAG: DUF1543 domain-containing protein [Pseudomonadota bacterium]